MKFEKQAMATYISKKTDDEIGEKLLKQLELAVTMPRLQEQHLKLSSVR